MDTEKSQNNPADDDFWKLDDQPSKPDPNLTKETNPPTGQPQTEKISTSSSSTTPHAGQKPTGTERIAIAALFLLLIGLAVAGYLYFLNQYDTSDPRDYLTNTPVSGEYAGIEKIETSWTHAKSGNVRLGVSVVPTARIHLSPESSSGRLRIVFYSSEKNSDGSRKASGDSISLDFTDGKFKNGEPSILVTGTDGLSSMGDFHSYRNQEDERWIVEIREAPSGTTAAKSFSELADAPIEAVFE